jgi:hypothetical protein
MKHRVIIAATAIATAGTALGLTIVNVASHVVAASGGSLVWFHG